MRVLVVEDDPHMQATLRAALRAADYDVESVETGNAAVEAIRELSIDIALLDLGLPDMDGKDVVRRARAFSTIPIIVLSARETEDEKIAALDLGANDYIAKPFAIGELLARIRVALRDAAAYTYVDAGKVTLDMRMRWVKKNGVVLKLTRKEYDVLVLLARNAGRAMTHREILESVQGAGRPGEASHLRVLIHQLRVKIEDDPAAPRLILTEPGVGYRFALRPVE